MYRTIALVLLAVLLSGCAMFRPGNPAITPGTGPGTAYPCGYTGVVCTDEAARLTPDVASCCWQNSSCRMDQEGPYCHQEYVDYSDPRTLGLMKTERLQRFGSSAP